MSNKYMDPVTWIGFSFALVLFAAVSFLVGSNTNLTVGFGLFAVLFVLDLFLLAAAP